jgi:two-component system sensor histidine kinase RegB
MWLNFVASAVMIAFFVARLSNVLRQRDAQLNQARELLLREARVEALNDQAAAVAHEIGTPLATLAVIAGELRADAEDAKRSATPVADYQPDLRTMEQQLELCRSILARLRTDHETLAPQRIDAWLAPFVERWQLRHPQASLQANAAPDAGEQAVDTARVSQILTIVLDNAARSQQAAGHDHREGPPLALAIAREGDALVYRVTDHGHGIPAALRSRLGEAPVASAHGGQGIGLYLAQSAARQLGGQIAWHDNPAGGTVVELRLPLAAAPERTVAAPTDFQP